MARRFQKRPDIGAKAGTKRPTDAQITLLADRQQGVVAYRQLMVLGFTRRQVQHRVAAGWLHRVRHGVYAVGRRSLTPIGHRMADVLSAGQKAVLSHRSAAAHWQIRDSYQAKRDVTVPTHRSSRGRIRMHYAKLHPRDVTRVSGIRVTTVARTLLDCAPGLRRDGLDRMLEEADRHGILDLRDVERCLARNPRHRGARRLTAALAAYREPPPTRSELERMFLRLIDGAGLPRPQVNVIVAGFEVDCLWPGAGLIVELDGRAYHSAARAFERDRMRDARLLRAGFRVLRITYRRLLREPQVVVEDVRALLAN